VHAVVEDDVPGLSRALGVVHGGVGVAEHVVRPPVAPGTRDDADAGRRDDVVVADLVRRRQRLLEPLGHHDGVGVLRDAIEQDHELVTAEPGGNVAVAKVRCRVAGSQVAREPLGDADQQQITDLVAKAVVDDLEAVKVQKEHGVLVVLVPPALPDGLLEAIGQQRPVRQTGEGVAAGLALQHVQESPVLEGFGHAGPKLVGVVRLGHIVRHPHLECPDLVVGVVRSREDDGDVTRQRIVLEPVTDAEAAHVGQTDVQQDQVRKLLAGLHEPLLAVLGGDLINVELVQTSLHEEPDLLRALDEEDTLAATHPVTFPLRGVP
jgi:hypothetical protein